MSVGEQTERRTRVTDAPRLDAAAERLLRDLAPRVPGDVIRRYGDFGTAEDAVQEALIAASTQWPRDGLRANPDLCTLAPAPIRPQLATHEHRGV